MNKQIMWFLFIIVIASFAYADDYAFTITRIKYSNGTSYSGTNQTTITLWDSYTSGSSLFNYTYNISYNNGTASIYLYNLSSLNYSTPYTYLSLWIENLEFTPRFNITIFKRYNTTSDIRNAQTVNTTSDIRNAQTVNTSSEVWYTIENKTFQYKLVNNCSSTNKASSFEQNGTIICTSDIDTSNSTSEIRNAQTVNTSAEIWYTISNKTFQYKTFNNCTGTDKAIAFEGNGTVICSSDLQGGNSTSDILAITTPRFVNLSLWTSIDNYPTDCTSGNYVYGLGDTLSCRLDLFNSSTDIKNAQNYGVNVTSTSWLFATQNYGINTSNTQWIKDNQNVNTTAEIRAAQTVNTSVEIWVVIDNNTFIRKTGDTMTGTLNIGTGGFGSGGITLETDGDLWVAGGLYIEGNITNVNVDNITVNGTFTPSLNNVFDLGTNTRLWNKIFATTLHGSLGWANLTSIPSDCTTNQYVYGLTATALSCRSDLYNSTTDIRNAQLYGINVTNTAWILANQRYGLNATGTLTNAKWCLWDSASSEIDCNVEPVTDTSNSTSDILAVTVPVFVNRSQSNNCTSSQTYYAWNAVNNTFVCKADLINTTSEIQNAQIYGVNVTSTAWLWATQQYGINTTNTDWVKTNQNYWNNTNIVSSRLTSTNLDNNISLGCGNITGSISNLCTLTSGGNTTSDILSVVTPRFVNLSLWTSLDNYPTDCSAGNYVYGLGDALSCRLDLFNTTSEIRAAQTINTTSDILGVIDTRYVNRSQINNGTLYQKIYLWNAINNSFVYGIDLTNTTSEIRAAQTVNTTAEIRNAQTVNTSSEVLGVVNSRYVNRSQINNGTISQKPYLWNAINNTFVYGNDLVNTTSEIRAAQLVNTSAEINNAMINLTIVRASNSTFVKNNQNYWNNTAIVASALNSTSTITANNNIIQYNGTKHCFDGPACNFYIMVNTTTNSFQMKIT